MILLFGFWITSTINAQNKQITGKVQDDSGPLPGVSIVVKGTTTGTTTDFDGNYEISVTGSNSVLVVSYIGYKTTEVQVGNRTNIDFLLQVDVDQLDEVVVVGYGSVKKSDLTGSVSSVSSKELTQTPISSLDQGLQGRAAGVQITQNSGAPGGATSIVIRGGNSLSTSNEPLYVVDGLPIAAGGSAQGSTGLLNGAGGSFNPLATLNPNDVESIEILKDASATSIYGARGANGVVLITTKKGREGRISINYNSYSGLQEVTKTLGLLKSSDYLELSNQVNPGQFDGLNIVETDWQDEIFRTAPIQNHQLSFSGGNDKSLYSFSVDYFDQEGIVINSDFERISTRLNLESKLSEVFKLGTNINYNYSVNNGTISGTTGETDQEGVVSSALSAPPILPAYDENGNTTFFGDFNPVLDLRSNPVALANVLNSNTSTRFLGNAYIEAKIFEGFTYRASFGVDMFHDRRDSYIGQSVPLGRNNSGIAGIGNVNQNSTIHESILNYQKNFGEAHNLSLTGVFSTQNFVGQSSLASGSQLTTDLLLNNELSLAAAQVIDSNKESWRLDSWTARANYILLDKYLFTFTGRADGSTRFGENNKWGFFPSAAFAWKIKNENFLLNNNTVSDLKLRLSYGITGNANIPLYRSLSRLSSGINYNFDNSVNIGVSPNAIANPDIKWERTAQLDIGLDIGLWNERVSITTDYYKKNTSDLLTSTIIPGSSGFSTVFGNFGEISNTGFELGISANVLNKGLSWRINGNFSINRNEVITIDGETDEVIPTGDGGVGAFANASILRVGEPVGSFFGYINDGIWQTTDDIANSHMPNAVPGDVRYLDFNGDGAFTAADRTIIGDPNPDFIFGINNTFNFKGVDFSFFFQGVQGNDLFFQRRMKLEDATSPSNQLDVVVNRWRPGNESDRYVRATGSGRLLQSSNFIEDGSFIRLKNITLGYSFNPDFSEWISSLRIYSSLNNIWTITNYSGFDPELNTTGVNNVTNFGVDRDPYPRAKSYLIGLQVSF